MPGAACPVFLAIERQRCINGYVLYERGLLPSAGGWLTQQEWWLQAFEVIGAAVDRVKRELAAPGAAPPADADGMTEE